MYLLAFGSCTAPFESATPTRNDRQFPSAIIAMAERCGGGGGAAERS